MKLTMTASVNHAWSYSYMEKIESQFDLVPGSIPDFRPDVIASLVMHLLSILQIEVFSPVFRGSCNEFGCMDAKCGRAE